MRFGDDDGPSLLYYKTVFALASTQQPDVRSLTCQSEQASRSVRQPLTLAEIRAALGAIAHFEWAQG